MKQYLSVRLLIFVVIGAIVLIPSWYGVIDQKVYKCTIEEFNKGKYNYRNHLEITGTAQYQYAVRFTETKNDSVDEVCYYVPFVDSFWNKGQEVDVFLV